MKFVHRGLEKLGKTIGQLTVLLLVPLLIGAPLVALFTFVTIATVYVAPLVAGGPGATAILGMAFLTLGCMFAGIYVAPHVPIGNAVGALLEPHAPSSAID
jgi:hypothetical protein